MSCQKQKAQKKEMKMTFSKEEIPHQCWIVVRRPLILTNELRNISKLVVLDIFLEPVLDFLGFHFFHRLFNCLLIPLSRVDLQKKHCFKEKDQPTGDLRTRFPLRLYCTSANPEVSNPACSSSYLFSWAILDYPPAAHSYWLEPRPTNRAAFRSSQRSLSTCGK